MWGWRWGCDHLSCRVVVSRSPGGSHMVAIMAVDAVTGCGGGHCASISPSPSLPSVYHSSPIITLVVASCITISHVTLIFSSSSLPSAIPPCARVLALAEPQWFSRLLGSGPHGVREEDALLLCASSSRTPCGPLPGMRRAVKKMSLCSGWTTEQLSPTLGQTVQTRRVFQCRRRPPSQSV